MKWPLKWRAVHTTLIGIFPPLLESFFSSSFSPLLVSESSPRSSCLPPLLLPQLRPSLLISFRGREEGGREQGEGEKKDRWGGEQSQKEKCDFTQNHCNKYVINLLMWSDAELSYKYFRLCRMLMLLLAPLCVKSYLTSPAWAGLWVKPTGPHNSTYCYCYY